MDSVPIVAITGQVPLSLLGKDFSGSGYNRDNPSNNKAQFLVKDVTEISQTIKEAFAIAKTGRPGPVLIDIPKDAQTSMAKFTNITIKDDCEKPEEYTFPKNLSLIDKAIEAIKGSERPVIYAGGGVITSGAVLNWLSLLKRL